MMKIVVVVVVMMQCRSQGLQVVCISSMYREQVLCTHDHNVSEGISLGQLAASKLYESGFFFFVLTSICILFSLP